MIICDSGGMVVFRRSEHGRDQLCVFEAVEGGWLRCTVPVLKCCTHLAGNSSAWRALNETVATQYVTNTLLVVESAFACKCMRAVRENEGGAISLTEETQPGA